MHLHLRHGMPTVLSSCLPFPRRIRLGRLLEGLFEPLDTLLDDPGTPSDELLQHAIAPCASVYSLRSLAAEYTHRCASPGSVWRRNA